MSCAYIKNAENFETSTCESDVRDQIIKLVNSYNTELETLCVKYSDELDALKAKYRTELSNIGIAKPVANVSDDQQCVRKRAVVRRRVKN